MLFLYLIMSKMKISVEDEGQVIFQTGAGEDVAPKSKKEVDTLIKKFKHNINFLKGVRLGIESTVDKSTMNSILLEEERVSCNGESQNINATGFVGGLCDVNFNLFDEFMINKNISSPTLKFISDTDIYYDKILLLKEDAAIPFFNSVQTWATDQYSGGIARVILDLRVAGMGGDDFEPNMLNDGKGYKLDFKIKATPEYDIEA